MKTPVAVLVLALAVPALAQSPAPPAPSTPPGTPPAAPKAESPPAAPASAVAPVAQAAPAYPDVKPGIVDGPTAFSLVAAGVTVVDVRTADEFTSGHLPGAIHIPYDEIESRKDEIGPRSIPVLVYCRSGRRSAIASAALQNAGFEKVYDLQSVGSWPGPLSR